MPELWDPLTYENLMAGTVAHFEKQERMALDEVAEVKGPGIYALYYEGAMAEYRPIADGARPIYAGKAVPKGSRTGGELDVEHPGVAGEDQAAYALHRTGEESRY